MQRSGKISSKVHTIVIGNKTLLMEDIIGKRTGLLRSGQGIIGLGHGTRFDIGEAGTGNNGLGHGTRFDTISII